MAPLNNDCYVTIVILRLLHSVVKREAVRPLAHRADA